MSSSNRVRLAIIAETIYGVTPGSGNFLEMKMTSEDLTGTPQTVQSAALRSDRQTSGQINTGLELSGGPNFELSYDASIRLLIEHAMMSDIVTPAVHTDTLTITGTSIATTGSFIADGIVDGDIVELAGMDDTENNTVIKVDNVLAGSMDFVGEGTVNGSGTGATATRPGYHQIGTVEKSLAICKEFLDVDDGNVRSISYNGMRTGEMSMNFAFGSIVTGRFALAGNGYAQPTVPMTDSRTVTAAGSDQELDASNGFGWLLVDDVNVDICIESLDFTLNNNLTAQNCIGSLAPTDQIANAAGITFNMTVHLGINSWDQFMAAKLNQTPISLSFYTRDDAGQGYAIVLERVQVNFPDPASSGGNSNVTLSASGTASYDSTTGRTMRIYLL